MTASLFFCLSFCCLSFFEGEACTEGKKERQKFKSSLELTASLFFSVQASPSIERVTVRNDFYRWQAVTQVLQVLHQAVTQVLGRLVALAGRDSGVGLPSIERVTARNDF